MNAPKLRFLSCLLLVTAFAGLSQASPTLQNYLMTKTDVTTCTPSSPPAAVTTFLTTDKEAYLWFYVTGANNGDVVSSEYYTPAGDLDGTEGGAWDPLASSGNYCFTDAPFKIAGAPPALLPGVWTVRVKYNGSLLFTLNFTIASSAGTGTTLTIPATANIFAAGRDSAFDGTVPPSFWFSAGSGAVVTFSNVTGSVNCTTGAPMNGPDGSVSCAGGSTSINSYQGISGIVDGHKSMFLAGVFLDDSTPADPAPASLDFTSNENFTTLAPQLRQVFFIGDGLTGDGTGATQQFQVPAGATRLFLGFADAFGFQGDPGYYSDNAGSLSATFILAGGQPGACTYSITPSSQSFSASGGNDSIAVSVGASCAWTAQSNDDWITVSTGASGAGNGTVTYSVAANTGNSSRTGTMTIAGKTFTVNQASSQCSYSLSATSASVASGGGTNGVVVSADTGCSWTAVSNVSWITIETGLTGSGSGSVSYTVDPNTGAARSGTLTIAGVTFTVTQDAANTTDAPAISSNGVVNAASFMPATLPGGAIARGSLFSIFGTNLGPPLAVQAKSFPLSTSLGGAVVKITQGGGSVNALPLYVSAGQINAIMPSNAPLGDVEITVTYNGVTSAPAALHVANTNFGAFNTSGGSGPGIFQNYIAAAQQPLNTRSSTARPGQVVTLWGTGLGPISKPDNVAPPAGNLPVSAQVLVGGKPAHLLYSGRAPCCAGVDQIVFTVPSDAVQGCYVPVQVKTGDASYSNTVTMAIDPKGQACSDPANPLAPLASKGGNYGVILLLRAAGDLQLDPATPAADFTLDIGMGLFQKVQPSGSLGFNPLYSFPPVGTCSTLTGKLDLSSILGGGTSTAISGYLPSPLDAGPALSIRGPDSHTVSMPYQNADAATSPYLGLLGGSFPLAGLPALPLFLNGGSYQVSAPGGKDVGPFSASIMLPQPVKWTNRDQIASIDRTAGVTLNWSGGNASSELVLIAGGSIDQVTNAGSAFFCFVPLGPGSFTVPPSVLANLPPSIAANPSETLGLLLLGAVPSSGLGTFSATGLDDGLIVYFGLDIKTVGVQ
ncbi:MAG TPA: BACON domain-containing carbohydrate-binding protein [Bryobacteraceae bacterium]|nr:BACON domain-containing carbohydrate-binding protein [Bryobacteraceae bacterium]